MPWEICDIVWGDTSKHLPYTCASGGSQTTHAMTRASFAVANECKQRLKEIAAKSLGGKPEEYEVANQRVFRKGGGAGLSFAQAAQRAIQLGGIYDGHDVNPDVNKLTKAAVAALAGQGLVVSAKDKYPHDGNTFSYVASFAEVEVDVETGKYYILDFLAYADVGTVMHPAALGGQILGRTTLGIAHAIGQKWVFDPHYGAARGQAFLPEQAAHDSGCARRYAMGSARHSRSGDAGWRARHWRAARWRRLRGDFERTFRRGRRRDIPARACQCGHDSDVVGSGTSDATSSNGAYLMATIGSRVNGESYGSNTRRDARI